MNTRQAVPPLLLTLLAACGGMAGDPTSGAASAGTADAALTSRPGAVFTMTDDPVQNAVLSFTRSADGALLPAGSTATGGAGSGGGEGVLGSQGALTLSDDGRFLLAVNGGSDEISAFRVDGATLTLAGRAPSGGALPVSVAVHGDLVYVANAGRDTAAASVSGLRLGPDGALTALPGSARPLSGAHPGPAQIAFDATGGFLVVTEKATQAISVYRVDRDGQASGPAVYPSAGATPFGFALLRDVLIVSEAHGGQPGASTASSYRFDDGVPTLTSAAVPDFQSAACWLVLTRTGHLAFVANTATANLSSYRVDQEGRIALLAGEAAALPGGRPLDLALGGGDRYLYALDAANHAIAAFGVAQDGTLLPLPIQATGLPVNAVGLAAR